MTAPFDRSRSAEEKRNTSLAVVAGSVEFA
jgi:hypothetical protein